MILECQPELRSGIPPVIDYSQAASLTLTTPCVGKTQLAQSAGTRNRVASIRPATSTDSAGLGSHRRRDSSPDGVQKQATR